MADCPKTWMEILLAFSTLITGVWVAYIAYMQYRLAALKREQDLFDKRYDLYKVVQDFIEKVLLEPKTQSYASQRNILSPQLGASYFLCGDDMREYLYDLLHRCCELEACNIIIANYNPNSPATNYNQALNQQSELYSFFRKQYYLTPSVSVLEQKFEKYLKMEKPGKLATYLKKY